jgi:hypothetical protein
MTRCINCGLPLSPTRTYTHCPRCSYALGTSSTSGTATRAPSFPQAWNSAQAQAQAQGLPLTSPGAPAQAASFNSWGQPLPAMPASQPATALWGSPDAQLPPAPLTPQPQQPWPSAGTLQQREVPERAADGGRSAQAAFYASRRPDYPRLGFFLSAICLVTAAILLLFVWFLSSNLPVRPVASNAGLRPATTTTRPTGTSQTTPTATASPSLTATALPGQSYIDHPQMASAVNPSTGQPTHLTTTFKPNQEIYVTFSLHPHGSAGAVCVYWYLNGYSVTNFAFAVRPSSRSGYSYAIYGQPGAGAVDLYWASSTQCSDKMLAQHVTFTVITE